MCCRANLILYNFIIIQQGLGGSLSTHHVLQGELQSCTHSLQYDKYWVVHWELLMCCWGDFDPVQFHYHTARMGWSNEHSSCAAGYCNPVHIHYLTTWIGWFIESFSCAAGEILILYSCSSFTSTCAGQEDSISSTWPEQAMVNSC